MKNVEGLYLEGSLTILIFVVILFACMTIALVIAMRINKNNIRKILAKVDSLNERINTIILVKVGNRTNDDK